MPSILWDLYPMFCTVVSVAALLAILLPALVSWLYDSTAAKGFVGHFILGWQCVVFAACFLTVAVALCWLFMLSVSVLVGNV